MKFNSIIHHHQFLYCRLQGIIWETSGLNTPFNIDSHTGRNLATIYKSDNKVLPLVINCFGVIDNDDHGFAPLFRIIDEIKRPIYFLHSENLSLLLRRLRDEHIKDPINVIEPNKKTFILQLKSKTIDLDSLYTNCENIENDLIREYISNSFEKFEDNVNHRLPSTPIVANGVFNSSNLISDPNAFMWVSIKLSDNLNEFIKNNLQANTRSVKLLSVSLRSSPFAAAVGLLNKIEVDVIDHLGPKSKIFDIDELQNFFWSEQFNEYIYIGDFIFGGTEVKIAQSFATLVGSKLLKALVIGSLFPVDVFVDCFDLAALVSLKNINETAKFALFEENL